MTITADRVRNALAQGGIPRIDHHPCGSCGYMTAYLIDGTRVVFDAGCECVPRPAYYTRSFQDIADWINMQSNAAIRRRLLACCGIVEQEETP